MSLPTSAFADEFTILLTPGQRAAFVFALDADPALAHLAVLLSDAQRTLFLSSQELNRVLDTTHPAAHALRLADYDRAKTTLDSLQAQYRAQVISTYASHFPALAALAPQYE